MVPLSDSFPEEYKQSYFQGQITVGAIFRTMALETIPPKEKICVVAGISRDRREVAIIFINSEINPFKLKNKILRELQIHLNCEKRVYLDHDSYLDCAALYIREFDDLQLKISANPQIHVGNFNQQDCEVMLNTLSKAATISKLEKGKYGFL